MIWKVGLVLAVLGLVLATLRTFAQTVCVPHRFDGELLVVELEPLGGSD